MLEQGEILKLSDNKEYVVVSSLNIDNETYVYLVEGDNNFNFMFCKYENNKLKKVTDSDMVETLLMLFKKKVSDKN